MHYDIVGEPVYQQILQAFLVFLIPLHESASVETGF